MISNIGCEDMAGVMRQWAQDTAADDFTAGWVDADTAIDGTSYDGDNSIGCGKQYEAPDRAVLGRNWGDGSSCGSRGSRWTYDPIALGSNQSGRGVAEPAANRL